MSKVKSESKPEPNPPCSQGGHSKSCKAHVEPVESAMKNFIGCHKPDPLLLRQLQSLHLEWHNRKDEGITVTGSGAVQKDEGIPRRSDGDNGGVEKTKSMQGVLSITGEYVILHLHTSCIWSTCSRTITCSDDDETKSSPSPRQRFQMTFRMYASATFTPKSIWKSAMKNKRSNNNANDDDDDDAKLDRKERKTRDKIRAGKIERMRNDSYIQKLFEGNKGDEDKFASASVSASASYGTLVCEASIQFDLLPQTGTGTKPTSSKSPSLSMLHNRRMDNLEERVYTSEDVLEGIRRATFSQMDETVSVMELLLEFPYLPRKIESEGIEHFNNNDDDGDKYDHWVGNMLAERTVLRILEDVMFDQCEKEGENDMLHDLRIGGEEGDDDDKKHTAGRQKERKVTQSHTVSDKRGKHSRGKKQKT